MPPSVNAWLPEEHLARFVVAELMTRAEAADPADAGPEGGAPYGLDKVRGA
jgi:hypothetical protein